MTEQLPLQEYLAFALALAQRCGQLAVENFRNSTAQRKADGTLVTETDEAIDRLISQSIGRIYPDHAVLSEEQNTLYDPAIPFTWVVDPVDGTTNFARGLPVWGISIGLLFAGEPVVGVVNFPMTGECFTAARGLGAHRSGVQIATSTADDVDNEQIFMKCTRTDKLYEINTPLKSRIIGSAAYHVCKVADGTGLACIEASPKVWDLAAAHLILTVAGGTALGAQGEALFPLQPQRRDYLGYAMPIFAAASPALRQHLTDHVKPRHARS